MLTDLRYAFRRLTKSPGFTLTAILTLALGIGASTAIFSIVNGVLLQPLALRQSQELVWLNELMPAFGRQALPVSAYHFVTWRERAKSFAGLSVVAPGTITLTGVSQPEQLSLVGVSANFFDVLSVTTTLGRGFLPVEETAGHNRVIVISDAFWRRALSSDTSAIGRTLLLDGEPNTIVGVLPKNFRYPAVEVGGASVRSSNPDIFRPKVFSADELAEVLGRHNYGAVARLKAGVTAAQAAAELEGIDAQIVREAGHPDAILRALLTPLHEAVVGTSRRSLLILFAAVTAVLLIGCVNLINFLLAQAEQRQQESAVRQALGATRGQLFRGALVETLLIALSGGVLGVVLAHDGLALLLQHVPAELPRVGEVQMDWRVLSFALALSLLTGLLFGLAPAWRLAGTDPQRALASGSRSIAGGVRSRRWTDALVATEVALSVVLLALAGLLGNSLVRQLRADQGFRAPTVLSANVTIPFSKYSAPEQRLTFFENLVERLSASPGVASAAMISTLPLQGENWIEKASVVGDSRPEEQKENVNVRFISPTYFQAIGLPLRAGRTFAEHDRNHMVAVISEQLARTLWPGQDPIGRVAERGPGDHYTVIGVVSDVRPTAQRTPVPTVYRPYWDWPPVRMNLVVRAMGDAHSVAGVLRDAIRTADHEVPLPAFQTMNDLLDNSVTQQRFQLLLASVFAGAALLLTALGLYGVVNYAVVRRRKELGVRIAFGASPRAIRSFVYQQGMRPVLWGVLVGLALAIASGRVVQSFLFETSPLDPFTLAGVPALLALVAYAACCFPARQATRTDPITALRAE